MANTHGDEGLWSAHNMERALGAAGELEHAIEGALHQPIDAIAAMPEVAASLLIAGVLSPMTVRALTLDESLDAPFEASIEVLASHEVSTRELPGRAARIELRRGDQLRRNVGGLVRAVDDLGFADGRHRLRFTVAPHLWLLSLRTDCRIFQDRSVCEVIDAVLDAANLYRGPSQRSWARVRRDQYAPREYCVQYRESDLAFVSRLLQEEGIAYFIDGDEPQGERLVFFDALSGASPVRPFDDEPLVVRGTETATASGESIRHFDWSDRLASRSVTLRDYDFTHPDARDAMTFTRPAQGGEPSVYEPHPRVTLMGDGSDPQANRDYAYTNRDGARRAETRLEELHSEAHRGVGVSNAIHMAPGRRFRCVDHRRGDLDDHEFVLVRARHTFHASESSRSDIGDADHRETEPARHVRYSNRFDCVAAEGAYRPARVTPRPLIHGSQTATVVAPDDQEVHVDTHGRIKVRFHWDRASDVSDEHRSCWMRVTQPWAGAGWGFSFVPRKGMEVVVHFLEGDPDRPIVSGAVYNGANRVSHPLEEARNRTKSWIRTQSTPGHNSGHYNELLFDDLAGHEEVSIHAQRDLNERVLHDHTTQVARNESNSIGGNQRNSVGGNRTSTVARNETVVVRQSRDVTVANNDALVVGESQTTLVNLGPNAIWNSPPPAGAAMRVGGEWHVEATEKIVFKVGDTRLMLTRDGLSLHTTGILRLGARSASFDADDVLEITAAELALTGSDYADVICEQGPTTIRGMPVQLNGPGLLAGRVTDAAPANVMTGSATVLVGGPTFPMTVERRASDGALLVGDRIIVHQGSTMGNEFQSLVMRDLGIISTTPHGLARLNNIDNNPGGHTVEIREYTAADAARRDSDGNPFGWNNSFASPIGSGFALGRDANDQPVHGAGSSSVIAYNPACRIGPADRAEPHDAVLFHELGHAEHNAYGVNRSSERTHDGWTDREDWQNIEGGINRPGGGNDIGGVPQSPTENEYLGDRDYPYRRLDHGQGYGPA